MLKSPPQWNIKFTEEQNIMPAEGSGEKPFVVWMYISAGSIS